jgi:S-DNA-T family DNA segregation ATPase FtsK/SpoIIIE
MKKNKRKKVIEKEKKPGRFTLPEEIKRYSWGIFFFLMAAVLTLSFFEKAGVIGRALSLFLNYLIGKSIYILPFVLFLVGLVLFFSRYEKILGGIVLASLSLILGSSGIFENWNSGEKFGGYFGELNGPLFKLFGPWITRIIFVGLIFMGSLIFWQLLKPYHFLSEEERINLKKDETEKRKPFIAQIFRKVVRGAPKFKIKQVPPTALEKETQFSKIPPLELKSKTTSPPPIKEPGEKEYQFPPLELLDSDKGQPSAGDIKQNSLIIKKTLENFGIPSQMSEVNIGPTVTQYTLKPADGIKLSKITALTNDLALALASHPIRIEAPVPGKSVVGIEIPNRVRTLVRLRDLISNPQFQNSPSNLTICLGRDVSGNPVYADLAKMPHLLVAGSTGTGKTIFLNSLILSLLYRNSPKSLRFILVDPKRVEFPIYNELPHLLTGVIFDAQKTVNALKWLIEEMERRFELLSEIKARDISGYNEIMTKTSNIEEKTANEIMPYIVLIVDELADLMAARGKEVEAGIVRLAQMARAVGIHLVMATQRPSVEVITGLIKANITSRVTFQVASQVDSRTVLDMAGAEKLLGLGDMLFLSAEVSKPRRIQSAFVSEKEVKRVVNWIKSKTPVKEFISELTAQEISLEEKTETEFGDFYSEDPLYEEAKRIVIEAKKASASFLQRKLKIGYARAARLIDMLEERGVVGPANGAKPREVYFKNEKNEDEGWQKI